MSLSESCVTRKARSVIFIAGLNKNNFTKDESNPKLFEGKTTISEPSSVNRTMSSPSNTSDTSNLIVDSTNSTTCKELPITLDPECSSILTSMLESEIFESGMVNPSEQYFANMLDKNQTDALNSISKVFMDNLCVDGRKVNNLIGSLHIISHFEYNIVYPIGQMMAIAALSHRNKEVCEFGIKCFENWENPDGIEKLCAVNFQAEWLKDYADQVIKELVEGD